MKLPTTLIITAICTLIYVFLSLRVIMARFTEKVALESKDNPKLLVRIRVHGNFAEYVPLALLFMGFLEISGADRLHLLIIGIILIVARIAHAIGLPRKSPNAFRTIGIVATMGVLITESIYAIVLCS